MPIPVVLIFPKSYKNASPTVTSNIPKNLPWESPLYYVCVITVFCLMSLCKLWDLELWIGRVTRTWPVSVHSAVPVNLAFQTKPVTALTLSSLLTSSELIKILTHRTLGWVSHWTSVERLWQVRCCIQQHSRDTIFALNTLISRRK